MANCKHVLTLVRESLEDETLRELEVDSALMEVVFVSRKQIKEEKKIKAGRRSSALSRSSSGRNSPVRSLMCSHALILVLVGKV